MRAVATLFWQSFAGTRLSALLSTAGVVLFTAGCALQLIVPSWTLGVGLHPDLALTIQASVQAVPWLAVLALFLATSAQPRIIRGLVMGHTSASLPHVRVSALLAAIAAAAAVSLAAATSGALFFVGFPAAVDLATIFRGAFVLAFLNFGVLYVAFLALAYIRGVWFFVGPTLIFLAVSTPVQIIRSPDGAFGWRLLAGAAGWLAYGAVILAGGRILRHASRWRGALGRLGSGAERSMAHDPESAVALLLGADRPWLVAVSQCLPVALAFWFARDSAFVLFGLVLFSLVLLGALNGARSMLAAPRSRSLWLRTDAGAAQLFRRADRVYLGHSSISLAIALVLFAGIAGAIDYPLPVIAIGAALLIVATIAGHYLGLAMTRGLPWGDALLAAATMGLVVVATALTIRHQQLTPALSVIGSALLAVTIALRWIAAARWSALDWMRCRPSERR